MRNATVFPQGMGYVMYAGGTVNYFNSLSDLRAFIETNNIKAYFADAA